MDTVGRSELVGRSQHRGLPECGGTRSRLFRLEGNVETIVAAVKFPIVNDEDIDES